MALIKGGRAIRDEWRHLGDDDAVPAEGKITLSWERWLGLRDWAQRDPAETGVRATNTVPPADIGRDVARLGLIVLSFPVFGDGRGFSQARVLRERFGFTGEIRATGNVLRDQLQFMERCGIDAFEVGERAIAENWFAAPRDFDLFYQPAADNRPWIQRQRRESAGR